MDFSHIPQIKVWLIFKIKANCFHLKGVLLHKLEVFSCQPAYDVLNQRFPEPSCQVQTNVFKPGPVRKLRLPFCTQKWPESWPDNSVFVIRVPQKWVIMLARQTAAWRLISDFAPQLWSQIVPLVNVGRNKEINIPLSGRGLGEMNQAFLDKLSVWFIMLQRAGSVSACQQISL